MVTPLAHRLVLLAMAAVFGVLSAFPRIGATTLHLATGDHLHFLFGDRDSHRHDHHDDGLTHTHEFDHEHPAGATACSPFVCDGHRHDCVEIGLPGGDYKPSSASVGQEVSQGWAALPPLPYGLSGAIVVVTPHPNRIRALCPLGFTPPDLVRSTVLLI